MSHEPSIAPAIALVGGTGNLGQALALRLAASGLKVIIGSRVSGKARAVADSLKKPGPAPISGMSNAEAVREADWTILAVPYEGHAQMLSELKPHLAGKVVISAVVPLRKGKPFMPRAGSALLEAQEILGNQSPVVGALHNISSLDLSDPEALLGDVLVCGDNAEAKEKVMELLRRLGARPLDAGPAAHAYIIEGLTGVLIQLNRKYKSKHAGVKITGIEG
jgi:NADPH-dependent F420 reductase